MIPQDLLYTATHEWARVEGGTATVGITQYAVEQLKELIYVEINPPGDKMARGAYAGVIESVKIAAEINAPLSGVMLEVNPAVADNAELISGDPYGAGWLFKIKIADAAELKGLLDAAAYEARLAQGQENH